jgi:hypothetical protein
VANERAARYDAGLMMRWVLIAVGLLLDLFGTIWLLQGLSILPGTFMRGSMTWVVIGVVMEIVGLGLVVLGLRMRPANR